METRIGDGGQKEFQFYLLFPFFNKNVFMYISFKNVMDT